MARFQEFTGIFQSEENEKLGDLGISTILDRDKIVIDLNRVEAYYPATENEEECGTKIGMYSGETYCITTPVEAFKKILNND